jgi:hypothetical protein
MRLALSAMLLLAGTSAAAQTAPQISLDTLRQVTERLSSDEFEGRAPGHCRPRKRHSPIIVERFKKAGLRPGNKGSWFQDVPLVEITAECFTPLSFTGGKTPVSARLSQGYGDRDLSGGAEDRGQGQRRRLRRLWHQRPRARLERLCRGRREGEDGRHPVNDPDWQTMTLRANSAAGR